MKVIAFNGSPRKTWNTATLLTKALEGAQSRGAETELIHLYDYNYSGCTSCFLCKLKDGTSFGKCVLNDDLTPFLAKIEEADAIILGSPNYIGAPTALMKAFMERLLFPYVSYDANTSSFFKKKIRTCFLYTMGATEAWMKETGYDRPVVFIENIMKRIFGEAEILLVNDTCQFDDYSKYAASRFDPSLKAERRATQFPVDCQKAFDIGVRLTSEL